MVTYQGITPSWRNLGCLLFPQFTLYPCPHYCLILSPVPIIRQEVSYTLRGVVGPLLPSTTGKRSGMHHSQ